MTDVIPLLPLLRFDLLDICLQLRIVGSPEPATLVIAQ